MSAKHPAELAAIAAAASLSAADIKRRDAIASQIGSLVVQQFHVALLRAATGSPTAEHFTASIERNGEVSKVGMDDIEAMQLLGKLPPEVVLWIAVIVQALHDELCGLDKMAQEEAHRYFWARHRHCLVRHCLLIGLQPGYVRELAGKAADFVDEQADIALSLEKSGGKQIASRADRLRQLIGEA